MSQFVLLLHDNPATWAKCSQEELQKAMARYGAYRDKLQQSKQLIAGQKLADEPGRVLRSSNGKTVATDGPYSETKEWLGGFFLIEAADYNAAVTIAKECPHLEYGGAIEVREVDPRTAASLAQARAS